VSLLRHVSRQTDIQTYRHTDCQYFASLPGVQQKTKLQGIHKCHKICMSNLLLKFLRSKTCDTGNKTLGTQDTSAPRHIRTVPKCGDGCLLSRLQRHGNVVPAWIVVTAHWTTVLTYYSVATVPASLPVLLSRHFYTRPSAENQQRVFCGLIPHQYSQNTRRQFSAFHIPHFTYTRRTPISIVTGRCPIWYITAMPGNVCIQTDPDNI